MRLLLRANTHRQVDTGNWEVAASPDTPLRERWQWQVRLHNGTPAPAPARATPSDVHRVDHPLPGGTTLEVAVDAVHVTSAVELADPGDAPALDRRTDELVVLIASGGPVLVEDRHLLADRDALVLEGDDPTRVGVRLPEGSQGLVAVVRLRSAGRRVLGWVP